MLSFYVSRCGQAVRRADEFWEHMLELQNQLVKSGGSQLLDEFDELKASRKAFAELRDVNLVRMAVNFLRKLPENMSIRRGQVTDH